jgi:hypothetical protein
MHLNLGYYFSKKKTLVKRKATPKVEPIMKKRTRRETARGSRRSVRLALTKDDSEEESTNHEVMDVSQ